MTDATAARWASPRARLAAFFAWLALIAAASAPGVRLAQASEPERLQIVTAGGPREFLVEVAHNDAERARGLMFRRFMPKDRGMLFKFDGEAPVTMWMRNTYIPLDMVFIGRDGRIVSIAENTEPLSERTIASGGPVIGVLEVNAGTAARDGIKVGDKVRHAMFGN
jgi:uncharacterized protein